MPPRPATAAAIGVLCVAAAVAGAGEVEDRYFDGLRDRGLFSVAEGASLRTLRDASLTPSVRQGAAVQLALTLAEHARFADGADRDALFERADDTLAEARRDFPAMPAVRLEVARGRVAAAAARLAARDALPALRPSPADLAAAETALAVADARLGLAFRSLDERLKRLSRGVSRDTEPLSAEELADLRDTAALERAELHVLEAELAPPDSYERERLAGSARSLALPVRRERLESRRLLTLADSFRLTGDSRRASESLGGLPAPAARLRLRRAAGGAGAAAAFVAAARKAAGGPLDAEAEFWAATVLADLAAEARAAGRADLADSLLGRLNRDAARAAAVHGGPWGRRAVRVAALAGRRAGFSPELAAAVETAEGFPPGSPAAAAAFVAAAELAAGDETAAAGTVLPLAVRAADAARAAGVPLDAEPALRTALDRFPATPGAGTASSAAVHLRLCDVLADRFAAAPSPETHAALADALTDHRLRFADGPTAAAATWRLARHEETRDQRTKALPLFRALLADPARRAAAAAGMARCHAGISAYLEREIRSETDPVRAVARRLQRGDRRAAALADLVPLATAPDPPGPSPATTAAWAELRLRTARALLAPPPGRGGSPDEVRTADALLARVRSAAAGVEIETPFWSAVRTEATRRGAITAAGLGRTDEAVTLAAALPDDPAALGAISAGWRDVAASDPRFAAARLALADRVLGLSPPPAVRRAVRTDRAAALLSLGRPSDAAADLLGVLAAGHDPAAAALAARAVAASRSPDLAARAEAAWRGAEDAQPEGSSGWLLARARRIAGLHAAGKTGEAAKLLAVTALLHPSVRTGTNREVRGRYAALSRALDPAPVADGRDAAAY